MTYLPEEDSYLCAQGRKLSMYRKSEKDGVVISHYRCGDCKGCTCRTACCGAKDPEKPKELRIKKQLWAKRAEAEANITTEEGVYLRLCRSIQVEGAFGLLAFNLKKCWMKREHGRMKTHLSRRKNA